MVLYLLLPLKHLVELFQSVTKRIPSRRVENGISFGSHLHLNSYFREHSGGREGKCPTVEKTVLKELFLAQGLKKKKTHPE